MKTTGANDILGSLSPASLPDRAVTYAIDIAKSVYRLILRRIERTQDKVNSEYNLLHWQKILSNKAWLKAKDLRDFLAPPDLNERLRKVDNQILRIDGQKYYQYRIGALGDLIGRHCGDTNGIVELGTGYGYNLFSLHLTPSGLDLEGFRYLAERNHRGTRNRRSLRFVGQDFAGPYRSDRCFGSQSCRNHRQGRPYLFLHRANPVRRPEGGRKYHCREAEAGHQCRANHRDCSISTTPPRSRQPSSTFARSTTRRSFFPRSMNSNARDESASSHANGCLLRHRSTTMDCCIAGSQHDHGQRRRYRSRPRRSRRSASSAACSGM